MKIESKVISLLEYTEHEGQIVSQPRATIVVEQQLAEYGEQGFYLISTTSDFAFLQRSVSAEDDASDGT